MRFCRPAVELAVRWQRCAQTATASQVDAADLPRSAAAAGLREEPALWRSMRADEAQRHPRTRKRRAL